MKLLHRRYYCPNVPACNLASEGIAFSESDYRNSHGRCQLKDKGCKSSLMEGDPLDYRMYGIAGLLAFCIIGIAATYLIVQWIRPAELNDVRFDQTVTEVQEDVAFVSIIIKRRYANNPLSVQYRTIPGSAEADLDYESVNHKVVMAKGEMEKTIVISILPDTLYDEDYEHFSVQLSNVPGKPQHKVIIREPMIDTAEIASVKWYRQLVNNAVNTAGELAVTLAKARMLQELLENLSLDETQQTKAVYHRLHNQQNRVLQLREQYIASVIELSKQDLIGISKSFKACIQDLEASDKPILLISANILQKHFQHYLKTSQPTMDQWMKELHEAIEDWEQHQLDKTPEEDSRLHKQEPPEQQTWPHTKPESYHGYQS